MSLTEFEKILDRYNKGICTVEEKRWLENWIKNNQLFQKNKWEYLSTEEKESILQQLFHRIDAHIQTTEVAEDIVQGVPLWRSRLAWWSVAMLIAILSVSVYMYSLRKESQKNLLTEIQWLHLEVSQGERKKIKLSDGTVIWLQGGSRLSYPHTFAGSDNRTVKFEGKAILKLKIMSNSPL